MKRKAIMKSGLIKACACLLAPFFCCTLAGETAYAQTEENKTPLNVYVLLGKDCAGNAFVDDLSDEQKTFYESGFENVYYYGRAEENQSVRPGKTNVLGHGTALSKFGVEIGFAETLSKTDGKSLIFKYALEDTGVQDYTVNGFFEMLSSAVETYEELNYDVCLKGSVYLGATLDENLSSAIEEIRREYASLGIEQKPSPFLVSGIKEDCVAVKNLPFVYPTEYKVATTAEETLLFGKTLAESLIGRIEEDSVRVVAGENGQADVEYALFEEESMTIAFTGAYGYYLSKLTINGEEIKPPADGKLAIEKGKYFIQAEFTEKEKFSLTVESEFSKGIVQIKDEQEFYYAGDIVYFTVATAKGYAVESVLFNGKKITANAGEYSVEIVEDENVITVVYMEAKEAKKEGTSKNSGCGAGIEAFSPLALLLFPVIFRKKKY